MNSNENSSGNSVESDDRVSVIKWAKKPAESQPLTESRPDLETQNNINLLITLAVALRAQMMLQPVLHVNTDAHHKTSPTVNCIEKPPQDFNSLMEVSESDYVEAKVYHLDQSNGVLCYKCKTCDALIKNKSKYKTRFQGRENASYKCDQCSKCFLSYKQLKSHLFRHSEKKLDCKHCSKKFLTKSEMKNHINTHTGQKPFECPVCSISFAQSSRYYAHIRTLHKKYHCDNCFRKSYNK